MKNNNFVRNLLIRAASVAIAFVLWLVVINVDDPSISRTFTGIEVSIINTNVLAKENKCFELLSNNTINVTVTAKRSILDGLSRSDISAVADMKELTFMNSVPIVLSVADKNDRIESVTTRTPNLKVSVEDVIEKTVDVSIAVNGEPKKGYLLHKAEPNVSTIKVMGPKSLVDRVHTALLGMDISGVSEDYSANVSPLLIDSEGEAVDDERLSLNKNSVSVDMTVYEIKEIPVTSSASGNPAPGFGISGVITTSPSSVFIAGEGETFDDMNVIYIPADEVRVDGVVSNAQHTVDISDYLPTNVVYADSEFDGMVTVDVEILPLVKKIITVPTTNISVDNVPEGYIAHVADPSGVREIEIQGLGDTFDRFEGVLAIGVIDASKVSPRDPSIEILEGGIPTGLCDGEVVFAFPAGISTTSPLYLEVVVEHVGTDVNVTAGAAVPTE